MKVASADDASKIPVVKTVKSFIVNMVDWQPSRLTFESGEGPTDQTVLAFNQRKRNVVAIEVWSSYFKPDWIKKTWAEPRTYPVRMAITP